MAKAGLLRDRVTFERLAEGSVDDYGNVYTGWENLASRSADLRERTGKEAITGGALQDKSMATMRVRSDSTTETVTAADRVIARGYTWAIKNVIQVDAKDTMIEFLLERGVAA
jgi:SPP1 family predicted phage head-tail adaptor